jgi:hypothetical protein
MQSAILLVLKPPIGDAAPTQELIYKPGAGRWSSLRQWVAPFREI